MEIIPNIDTSQDNNRYNNWFDVRQDDVEKDLKYITTIDDGRLVQFFGNSRYEISKEENTHG